jgi:hypothetical protein
MHYEYDTGTLGSGIGFKEEEKPTWMFILSKSKTYVDSLLQTIRL